MIRPILGLAIAVAGVAVAPQLALALPAVTTEPTNLRAGPAFDFPVVDRIPADARVNVLGCVRGFRWCDVSWRDARGWVPGNELAYLDGGRRVTIVDYGPRIGLPVVFFSFDTYWDRHYRGRTWYGERARWRTVWRDRERGDRQAGDRDRDREGRNQDRTERRDADRQGEARRKADRDRQSDRSERRMDSRTDRGERPSVRSERGDRGERGQVRGYNPPGVRQEPDRGPRQGVDPGRGRGEPSFRPQRGPEGGRAGDGRGREDR
jgi:uncharacterized protein YraI